MVHFCICLRDSAVLSGYSYLFRQWPACVRVPNCHVLGVSAVESDVYGDISNVHSRRYTANRNEAQAVGIPDRS